MKSVLQQFRTSCMKIRVLIKIRIFLQSGHIKQIELLLLHALLYCVKLMIKVAFFYVNNRLKFNVL